MIKTYDDLIHLPRHISSAHPHMDIAERAAQFSPFAALTGYDAAIRETARRTDERVEADEYFKECLRERLQIILDRIKENSKLTITYFQPDEKKDGGAYITVTDSLNKADLYGRILIMTGGKKIPIDDIINIEGELFETQIS
ncbi:MAG: hypothetical protein QM697_09990 [Lachnospiraceae bacterium]